MRVGLDLRGLGASECRELSIGADELGLWAVLVDAPAGAETSVGAELATATEHLHLGVHMQATPGTHPLELAEEIAILDQLSARRALAVVDGPAATVDHVRRLLAGELVDGIALTPPPAQTTVPVWAADFVACRTLTGDLDTDRSTIDGALAAGITHLFVAWPGSLPVLARHLATRAQAPDFPTIVADYADMIAPLGDAR